jgi:Periplasmic binding protein domain
MKARAFLISLILGLTISRTIAQPDITIAYVVGYDVYLSAANEACDRVKKEMSDVKCVFNTAHGDIATQISMIENLVTEGVSGIVLQAVDPEALRPTLQKAADAGIRIAVWSDTSIDQLASLSKQVLTVVGVPAQELASQLAATAAQSISNGQRFCLISFAGNWDDEISGLVSNQLEEKGFSTPDVCKQSVENRQAFFDQLSLVLRQEDISVVILPFEVVTDEFNQLKQIANNANRSITFISGWADPAEINYISTIQILKAIRGESVESHFSVPAIIQVSTDGYCSNCECSKETRCKRECSKCRS